MSFANGGVGCEGVGTVLTCAPVSRDLNGVWIDSNVPGAERRPSPRHPGTAVQGTSRLG